MSATSVPPADVILDVQGLSKSSPARRRLLGRTGDDLQAVRGISFQVRRGETLALVGESGCGKTTTARTLLRLLEPSGGRAFFRPDPSAEAVDLFALSQREMRAFRRELQIIFQDPFASLNPRHSVAQIIGEGLAFHGLARGAELERRVDRLIARVGLDRDARDRFPHEFSGGQRQRIGIARALALEPRFIVCDEAVSALDVSIQAQILNLLRELQREDGLSYLFIAHDLSVVRHFADRVAVMYRGEIVEEGPAREVFEAPRHAYTRELLAAVPRPDPRRRRRRGPSA